MQDANALGVCKSQQRACIRTSQANQAAHACHTAGRRALWIADGIDSSSTARAVRCPRVETHIGLTSNLDAARVKDFCAMGGKLKHLIAANRIKQFGAFDNARVGAVNAIDIRTNLTVLGAQGRGQCHGSSIRSTAAQGGNLAFVRDALKACDDHDLIASEFVLNS